MLSALTILFISASGALVSAAQVDTNKPAASTIDHVVITAVSPDPIAPSGVFATAVEFSGVTEEEATNYYIPFMSIGQAKPRTGQLCEVGWQWHDKFNWITAKGSVQGVRLVTKYTCEGEPKGSF